VSFILARRLINLCLRHSTLNIKSGVVPIVLTGVCIVAQVCLASCSTLIISSACEGRCFSATSSFFVDRVEWPSICHDRRG
jgi:hypothetical protein